MPDNTNQQNIVNNAAGHQNDPLNAVLIHVSNIDSMLQDWDKKGGIPSQANARAFSDTDTKGTFRRRQNDRLSNPGLRSGMQDSSKGFIDSFNDAIFDGFFGSNFKGEVQNIFKNFAKQLNVDVKDISGELGKQLGNNVMKAFKQSDLGKQLTARYGNAKQNIANYITNRGTQIINDITSADGVLGADAINRHISHMNQTQDTRLGRVGGSVVSGIRGTVSAIGSGIGAVARGVRAVRNSPGVISSILDGSHPLTDAGAVTPNMSLHESSDGTKPTNIATATTNTSNSGNRIVDAIKETSQSALREVSQENSSSGSDKLSEIAIDVHAIRDSMLGSPMEDVGADELDMNHIEDIYKDVNGPNNLQEQIPEPTDMDTLLGDMGEGLDGIKDASINTADDILNLGTSGGEAAGNLINLTSCAGTAAVAFIAFQVVTSRVSKSVQQFKEGLSKMLGAMSRAANRDKESREQNLKLERQRIKDDFETLVKYPFQLLEEAANKLYDSWDSNLKTVAATQGYTKSDVQDLQASIAQRLRDEGLTKYISGADVFDNLANVLKSGLSGAIAEEFAYQATVLNQAVPTQDFFQYASTYASIAANAQRSGASQQEAIAKANDSLSSFANSLLYASRELTGGFTSGLQSASSIYEDSAKIAVAARSENLDAISGTLLAIQGYVGAVAPDLASSLTSAIYQIATGGNSASDVALRSLAGVNASNTEFLKAFSQDPQEVLSTMFTNLATMFADSSDAYMEKASGYAELFGLSSEAFQRIDFSDLAKAIQNMNLSSDDLNENMQLLLQGQTTTTTEQLKQQQINQYMIEEGLSYVLDNEANRAIQQHMWDEQRARELMEANYSVDLVGDSRDGLLKIVEAVQGILDLLNPFSWLKKIGQLISTSEEYTAQKADVRQLLELSKVGNGNATSLYQLTTTNTNLGLTRPLVDQLGGSSAYAYASMKTKDLDNILTNPLTTSNGIGSSFESLLSGSVNTSEGVSTSFGAILSALQSSQSGSAFASRPSSKYSWGTASKSASRVTSKLLTAGLSKLADDIREAVVKTEGSTAISASATAVKTALDKMMDQELIATEYVSKGKTYEDWVNDAKKYGISDYKEALTTAGYEEEDVRKFFTESATTAGAQEDHRRDVIEEDFWNAGLEYWTRTFWSDYKDPFFTHLDVIESKLEDIKANQVAWSNQYKTDWTQPWGSTYWPTTYAFQTSSIALLSSNIQKWTNWTDTIWSKNWVETTWNSNWVDTAWNTNWLNSKWSEYSTMVKLNSSSLINSLNSWINDVWKKEWVKSTWSDSWVTDWKKVFGDGKDFSFRQLYQVISDYMLHKAYYGVSSDSSIKTSDLWKSLREVKADTDKEGRESSAYEIGKVLADTLITKETTDPTLQTNIILGQILVYVGQIVQQTADNSSGGSSFLDSLSAMALGLTTKTS